MECLEAEQDSDGSSSLDLSLKKMSSKMVLNATQQLVCQIPRIKEYENDEESPLVLERSIKLIDFKAYSQELADICANCYVCMSQVEQSIKRETAKIKDHELKEQIQQLCMTQLAQWLDHRESMSKHVHHDHDGHKAFTMSCLDQSLKATRRKVF